jgi:hypothetical protein
MKGESWIRLVAAVSVAVLAACSGNATMNNQSIAAVTASSSAHAMDLDPLIPNVRPACGSVPLGQIRCFALIRTDIAPSRGVHPSEAPSGYGPADLWSAYELPHGSKSGEGQVFAVVDAFDDPNAEADLAVYRMQFGLKPCTTANKCFRKVDQTGKKNYPPPDQGWADEISVDLDTASATCQNCKLILVEASAPTKLGDLSVAEDEAVKLGANVVSNSYGDYPEWTSYLPGYDHPGHMIVAASGDGGYAYPFQPCSLATVVCVGGTSLVRDGALPRGWSEISWHWAGSGCSIRVAKPAWQTDLGCPMRSWSDVAAVADPNTGIAFYDTYESPGWGVSGGTSVASPLVAGAYALAGNAQSQNYAQSLWQAGGTSNFRDIIKGPANGKCFQYKYVCTPGPGYDGITGWGAPQGLGAF